MTDEPQAPPQPQVWRWEYEGDTWTLQDYTLDELRELEKALVLDGWYELLPKANAAHAYALFAARLRRTLDEPKVLEILERTTLGDLQKMLNLVDGDGLPDNWEGGRPLLSGKASDPATT